MPHNRTGQRASCFETSASTTKGISLAEIGDGAYAHGPETAARPGPPARGPYPFTVPPKYGVATGGGKAAQARREREPLQALAAQNAPSRSTEYTLFEKTRL